MNQNLWQGRDDTASEGELGRRWHQVVSAYQGGERLALLGFACDAGVARNQGRTGAAQAPQILRQALANLPVRGDVPADAGDIVCVGDELEAAQALLSARLQDLMQHNTTPIALGGGHEIAYASGMAMLHTFPKKRIGIINLDAHLDLRADPRPSSGTPFRQLAEQYQAAGQGFHYACWGVSRFANTEALFARAKALQVDLIEDTALSENWTTSVANMQAFCEKVDVIYLSLDLDVLSAAFMPAVSAPAALGLNPFVVEKLIQVIAQTGKIRLCDVAEFNPRFDIDGHGARTAARLIAVMVEALQQ